MTSLLPEGFQPDASGQTADRPETRPTTGRPASGQAADQPATASPDPDPATASADPDPATASADPDPASAAGDPDPHATTSFALVDDATAVRESLAVLLPDLRFVSSHQSVEEFLAARPIADVVILDLHLVNLRQPEAKQGVAAIRDAVDAGYRVCVYTQEERRFVLAACLAAGATGVVSKSSSMAETRSAFLAVSRGELVAPPPVTGLIEVLVRRGRVTVLNRRQREVLAGRARGLTYAELSRTLFLSESTLRGYWRDLSILVSAHLQESSPGDIEHALGLRPGDLLDHWPAGPGGAR